MTEDAAFDASYCAEVLGTVKSEVDASLSDAPQESLSEDAEASIQAEETSACDGLEQGTGEHPALDLVDEASPSSDSLVSVCAMFHRQSAASGDPMPPPASSCPQPADGNPLVACDASSVDYGAGSEDCDAASAREAREVTDPSDLDQEAPARSEVDDELTSYISSSTETKKSLLLYSITTLLEAGGSLVELNDALERQHRELRLSWKKINAICRDLGLCLSDRTCYGGALHAELSSKSWQRVSLASLRNLNLRAVRRAFCITVV